MQIDCSKNQLKNIGKKIRNGEKLSIDDEIVFSLFRKGHDKILSSFRSRINNQLSKYENENVIFAQRLKKRDTIINKLRSRYTKMDLLRMHDIAGMRLIFSNIKSLEKFRNTFITIKGKKYVRTNSLDKYDYIKNPRKKTGYRGIHDIYEEKTDDPIKMHMELQYRTKVQHAWSTTLEIWDSTFKREAKFENESEDVTTFFRYLSELFARIYEKSSFISELNNYELFKKIISLDSKLGIIPKLRKIKKTNTNSSIYNVSNDEYILLKKIFESQQNISLHIELPKTKDIDASFDLYKELEKFNSDVVMVQVKQPKQFLDKAYNNYYNDLTEFFKYYDDAIKILKEDSPRKYSIYALTHNIRYFNWGDLFNAGK